MNYYNPSFGLWTALTAVFVREHYKRGEASICEHLVFLGSEKAKKPVISSLFSHQSAYRALRASLLKIITAPHARKALPFVPSNVSIEFILDDEESILGWRLTTNCFYFLQAGNTHWVETYAVLGVLDVFC